MMEVKLGQPLLPTMSDLLIRMDYFPKPLSIYISLPVLNPFLFLSSTILVFVYFICSPKPVSKGQGKHPAIPLQLKIFRGIRKRRQPFHRPRIQDIPVAQFQSTFFIHYPLTKPRRDLSRRIQQLLYVVTRPGSIKTGQLTGIAFPKRELVTEIHIELTDLSRIAIPVKSS